VQDFDVLYNDAAHPVICEGWHLHVGNTYMTASFRLGRKA